jgi:hypothetical protein
MSDVSKKNISIYIDQTAASLAIEELNKTAAKLTATIVTGTAAGKNMVAEIKKLATTNEAIKNVQTQIDKG